jgi:hypothetical protein
VIGGEIVKKAERVRAEPFAEVELPLGVLFGDGEP